MASAPPSDISPRFAPESAPSQVRPDEPTVARFVGVAGLLATVFGVSVLYFNSYQPRFVGPITGWISVVLGLATMLYHAARDLELQIRRSYAAGAILVIVASAIASCIPSKWPATHMLPWGAMGLLIGLFFLLAATRNEDDPAWFKATMLILGGVGAVLAFGGFLGGMSNTWFLLHFSVVMGLIGLLYLWGLIGHVGSNNEFGYKIAWLIGAAAVVVIAVSMGRSVLPWIAGLAKAKGHAEYFLPGGLLLTSLAGMYLAVSLGFCSDRQLVVMTRRELAAYFYSPIAYVVLFGVTVIGWIMYVSFVGDLMQLGPGGGPQPHPEPIIRRYVFSLLPVIAVIFVVPVLTMRLLSEEHRTGTMEVLLTAPISETTVVLSKFLASLIFFLLIWAPWGLFLLPLAAESKDGFDYRPLLSFFVALTCSGSAFLSMGLFFSSLTRNQIAAAILAFMGMMVLLAMYLIPFGVQLGPTMRAVFQQMSFLDFWGQSLSGKLYLKDVATQLSLAVFWLFLTVKVLESRKWA